MTGSNPSLADELRQLIQDQRLSYAHIGRIGHLSRNTIKQIADGKTREPNADTLCRICVGLGADPYTGRINQETMVMALDKLGAASGHPDLREECRREILPVLLATLTGDVERAAAWVELVADFRQLDPDVVRDLLARIARRPLDA